MKKRMLTSAIGLLLIFLLASCSSNQAADAASAANSNDTAAAALDDSYDDALSVQGQLALGTVRLEESELAVDEAQAADLLPLWQALQSLNASDTAAPAEIEALVDQIVETMKAQQIEAIAGMALTNAGLTEMLENGELAAGFAGFRGQAATEDGDNGPGGGGPGGGFPGGGPGGGFPGGGPGGGFPGAGGGELSEEDIATRRAEFAAEGGFQEQALTPMVISLLQTKTGQATAGNMASTVFDVVSEQTGLTVEELQAQTAQGSSLAEIIEANGGDVTAVRDALVEALDQLPNAPDLDAGQVADRWLGLVQETEANE